MHPVCSYRDRVAQCRYLQLDRLATSKQTLWKNIGSLHLINYIEIQEIPEKLCAVSFEYEATVYFRGWLAALCVMEAGDVEQKSAVGLWCSSQHRFSTAGTYCTLLQNIPYVCI